MISLIVLITLAALIVAVRALGDQFPHEPFYLDTGGSCLQPCWYGIQPGRTKIEDARRSLETNPLVFDLKRNDPDPVFRCELEWKMQTIPFYTGCISALPDSPISDIFLRLGDDQVRLADAFALFGQPITLILCRSYQFGLNHRQQVFALVYFQNGVQVWAYNPKPMVWRAEPLMYVKSVHYNVPGPPPAWKHWRGFLGDNYYHMEC